MFVFTWTGEHENQLAPGGEVSLHTHVTNCKKNPGHPEFIPIESFSLKHLPEGHQDIDLYEYIKAIADLTVRLSVTMTSPHRPEFWPNTKIPYFLSDMRGKETWRTGSGRVRGVRKYTDEGKQRWRGGYTSCPCDKCKASDKPSKVWWKIDVVTAAHVVFDDIEASHTTLRLFYDSDDSKLVLLKDKVGRVDVDIEKDRCRFHCVTCDENLGNKLEKMLKHYGDVREKVLNKYKKSRDIDKINFIVSHPHGCSKQVSVGQWKDKVQVGEDEDDHKFTYTTCTCPGSSGATVHCVGYDYSGWSELVHSGSLNPGLNYSGVGAARLLN